MGYRKEGMPKKNYLKRINQAIEEKQGFIYFILFILMLSLIPPASERMARFILMIELETMTLIVKTLIYIVTILSVLITITKTRGKTK